jgi:beta-glucanase (GH16 family)
MNTHFFLLLVFFLASCNATTIQQSKFNKENTPKLEGYQLIWHEEFNYQGKPNCEYWNYEQGFSRNNELQWYQPGNANCDGQVLKIEARREKRPNPNYSKFSSNWQHSREFIEYTSSSIMTKGKKSWKYGRFEIRAKIPVDTGAWPAIWTLGVNHEWPSNGEIDLMEFYIKDQTPGILANAAWGTKDRWVAQWDSSFKPLKQFIEEKKDPNWAEKFHVWRIDWDENNIKLYLDDELLNDIELSKTNNPDGFNPFRQEHYLLLNLAIGENGGDPSGTTFPLSYEVDYVRVYQKLTPQQ